MDKKIKKIFATLVVLTLLILVPIISAEPQMSYCCEKTVSGAYCQNVPSLDMCNPSYSSSPTLCESTSYCKRGCCFDSDEGLCMESTPRSACDGLWEEGANCQIPQCDLGCCIIGANSAFTTPVRCNRLSSYYGLKTNFISDVQDEIECLEMANAQDTGACVYEDEYFQTTCTFGTRANCDTDIVGAGGGETRFHANRLCTDPALKTNCRMTENTKCVDGRVYFIDSCHNQANIYDATKIRNNDYWSRVYNIRDSCDDGSIDCGNCDYIGRGSVCSPVERGGPSPMYGENYCSDVNCYDTSNGKDYRNGESWCFYDQGSKSATVGSVHYLHKCFMGVEYVEACDNFRNSVCLEKPQSFQGGSFSQAGCVPNRWQECAMQNTSTECLNPDKRDCKWIPIGDPEEIATRGLVTNYRDADIVLSSILNIRGMDPGGEGRCVPDIPPGLDFWDGGTFGDVSAEEVCNVGTQSCIIKYKKGLIGSSWECVENCWCEEEATAIYANFICKSYGDCGADRNYIGQFVNKGYEIEWGERGKEPQTQRQPDTMTTGPTTGNFIQGLVIRTYNLVKR